MAVGLHRTPTSFMDRHTQQDMCAELEEETQSITLITVNQRLSGLQVSLRNFNLHVDDLKVCKSGCITSRTPVNHTKVKRIFSL